MQHRFPAERPVQLYVELRSGDLTVNARDVDHVVVDVEGDRDQDVHVQASDDRVNVVEPKHTGFSLNRDRLSVTVTVPVASTLVAKLGSASVRTVGPLALARVNTASGDITLDEVAGPTKVRTGSGQISLRSAEGGADIKAGSGDIRIEEIEGDGNLVTGSGDVLVSRAGGRLNAKSGSGDLVIED